MLDLGFATRRPDGEVRLIRREDVAVGRTEPVTPAEPVVEAAKAKVARQPVEKKERPARRSRQASG
jgi:hypothetical protein